MCLTCSEAINECLTVGCPPDSSLCSGSSATLWQTLKGCTCQHCSNQCPFLCSSQGNDPPGCGICIQAIGPQFCLAEADACENDM